MNECDNCGMESDDWIEYSSAGNFCSQECADEWEGECMGPECTYVDGTLYHGPGCPMEGGGQ